MTPLAARAPGPFLSCDWGTSAFRLRLIEGASRRILATSRGAQGIAATFTAWKSAGAQPEHRRSFFSQILADHLARIAEASGGKLAGLPLVISGMASSSIGMRELPYARLPLAIDGSGLAVEHVAGREDFPHPVVLISGVRSHDDVMRGEETQLIGACTLGSPHQPRPEHPRVFIFPGTHAKHVEVREAQAVAFRTYMTGEFFELLTSKSDLAHSVKPGAELGTLENLSGFAAGVRTGAAGNLLNATFRVRTRALFAETAAAENYHFLSGVLIGAELRDLAGTDTSLTLVGGEPLLSAYQHAFQVLGARASLAVLDADDCLIAGQLAVANRLGLC